MRSRYVGMDPRGDAWDLDGMLAGLRCWRFLRGWLANFCTQA